ncbi:hypothetical protein ACHAW6_015424 [Cyclotella cf. meneghiniana]
MRKPITSGDIITIRGKHLYVGDDDRSKRFFVRGIAFPIPPPSQTTRYYYYSYEDIVSDEELNDQSYLSGWISVLEQLANDTDINTIRLYEMDCRFNYSTFLSRAAELGIYVMIPLTTLTGPGVLRRTTAAPACYSRILFDYGASCLERFWDYPNVIAGVVGNEVMNSLKGWKAAPCVKAYLDDLARFGKRVFKTKSKSGGGTARMTFPLLYAAQHDSPSAEQLPDEAIKLTFDYLSCHYPKSDNDEDSFRLLDNTVIFGINIESWCSSLQTFDYEENGIDESSYHSLWRTLFKGTKLETTMDAVTTEVTVKEIPTISPKPLSIPIVFSEMGCSKYLFNRDNGLQQPSLARDWKQIAVVLDHPMSDEMSGFIAYGYDGGGNAAFRMMGDDNVRWDGIEPLPPSMDYDNFCNELSNATRAGRTRMDEAFGSNHSANSTLWVPARCEEISTKLEQLWSVELYPLSKMPSYNAERESHINILVDSAAVILSVPEYNRKVDISVALVAIIAVVAAIAAAAKYQWSDVSKKRKTYMKVPADSNYGSCKC